MALSPLSSSWQNTVRRVLFDKQPPPTVRKSNFFSFTVQLQDCSGQRLRVKTAKFIDFLLVDWPAPPAPESSVNAASAATPRSRSQSASSRNRRVKQEPSPAEPAFKPLAGTPTAGPVGPGVLPGLYQHHFNDSKAEGEANASGVSQTTTNNAVALPAKSNGIEYEVELEHPHGRTVRERLFLCLVDNRNQEVVRYEGQDRNPEMRRVLLTHEVTCSRCSNNATGCGNKTAAPSDPTIHKENGQCSLVFHVKCNQNCLRTPGSPKQGRRFKLLLSTGQTPNDGHNHKLGTSEEIFVHNNSKHGRLSINKQAPTSSDVMADSTCGLPQASAVTPSSERAPSEVTVPCITLVWPKQGWTTGGTRVAIIGENFTKNMQVVFGHQHVEAEMYNNRILLVVAPRVSQECVVEITLMQRQGSKMKQSCTTLPGHFQYVEPVPSMECMSERLHASLSLPIHTVIPMEEMLSLINERLMAAPPRVPQPIWPVPRAMKRPHQSILGRRSMSSDLGSPTKARPAPLVIPDSANSHLSPVAERNDISAMFSASNQNSAISSGQSWKRACDYPPGGEQLPPGHTGAQGGGHAPFYVQDQQQHYAEQAAVTSAAGTSGAGMVSGDKSLQSSHPSSPSPDISDRNHNGHGMAMIHDDPISLASRESDRPNSVAPFQDGRKATPGLVERPPSNSMQHVPMQPPPQPPIPQHSMHSHFQPMAGPGHDTKPAMFDFHRHPQMRPPSGPGIPAPPGMPTTPGMAVYYPGGSMPPGQNAPSAVPYALYPGSIYSPSFALASPASFAHTSGQGGESIFTFPPAGAPPPSGLSLSGQSMTPIFLMDTSSSAFAPPSHSSQSLEMSGSQAAGYPSMASYPHPSKKAGPSHIGKPPAGGMHMGNQWYS